MSYPKIPLFNNGVWQISAVKNGNGMLDPSLFVENLKTGFCDWPIQYENGQVAYDCPERLPKYVKRSIVSLYSKHRTKWATLKDVANWHLL